MISQQSRNLLIEYYHRLAAVSCHALFGEAPNSDSTQFSPEFRLPPLDGSLRDFLTPATAAWTPLGRYRGHELHLLDLMRNPATQTTKTYASLLMVARAVEHIRRTGQRIAIFTPTSGNKGIALRDAVERAIIAKIVTPDELSIVTLAPWSARTKFRSTQLSTNIALRHRNPALFYSGSRREEVKALLREFVRQEGKTFKDLYGMNIWFSLDIRNYMMADAARAFLEHEVHPTVSGSPRRIHAHAVSSGFGLLGYNLGNEILASEGLVEVGNRPSFLLVQHLDTPDMVLHALYGSTDRLRLPTFHHSETADLYEQYSDPHFPLITDSPNEVIDPTFYTRQPSTTAAMSRLIAQFGGTGIVVSRHECLMRHQEIRRLLTPAGLLLRESLDAVREWSLIMAMTGVLNSIDRGLIEDRVEVVIHGSGYYCDGDYDSIEESACIVVNDMEDLVQALLSPRGDTVCSSVCSSSS